MNKQFIRDVRKMNEFIGIEINQSYVDIANKRLQEEKDKLALFGESV